MGTDKNNKKCPLWGEAVGGNPSAHREAEFRRAVLADKARGIPDAEIGRRYGISYNTLQAIITEAYGINVSALRPAKRIRQWQPSDFHLETTTVWSFKQRGNWATHDGRYRGNWSPYIPRNIILRTSRPGDLVLDYFVGSGTTAIEAKLLGRRCIARDINPEAVTITRQNLNFSPPQQLLHEGTFYEPVVEVGDARDLSGISDGSVDLICAHPPYAGIVKYSSGIPGDLSALPVPEFLEEMRKVAGESWRVLKPGGTCAILVGDARRSGYVVPIGWMTARVFLDTGFRLRELVIKRQHNCRATGLWYTRSIQYNFLLLAHEYLLVLEKPDESSLAEPAPLWEKSLSCQALHKKVEQRDEGDIETTTVWIFPTKHLEEGIRKNLLRRFAGDTGEVIEVQWEHHPTVDGASEFPPRDVRLLWIRAPDGGSDLPLRGYLRAVAELTRWATKVLALDGFLAIEAKDFRRGDTLVPSALCLWEEMNRQIQFALKEIVIVAPEEQPTVRTGARDLEIVHKYLLIYTRKGKKTESR